jgi:hypothetical protein
VSNQQESIQHKSLVGSKRKVQEMKKLIHKFGIKTDELGLQLSNL